MAKQDTSGVHVWLVLWKATSAIEAHAVRSIAELGMCQSDFAILEALLHKGAMPINAIGKKILLTSGSITTAVDRLEERGFVERKWEHEDRRVCLVDLTSAGRKLIEKAFRDHAATMEQAAAGLSRGERETLIALLKKLGLEAQRLLQESASPLEMSAEKERKTKGKL